MSSGQAALMLLPSESMFGMLQTYAEESNSWNWSIYRRLCVPLVRPLFLKEEGTGKGLGASRRIPPSTSSLRRGPVVRNIPFLASKFP